MTKARICGQPMRIGIRFMLLCIFAALPAWAEDRGPDAFGYVATDDTPYSFIDISTTGTKALQGIDDDTATVNLGFTFNFYGKPFTSVCISVNGLLSFGGCNMMDIAGVDLTGNVPNGDLPTIAPLWFDLTFRQGTGAVYYQTIGQTGTRQFIVQWQNANILNGTNALTFQTILMEDGGKILIQYMDVDAGSGSKASSGGLATIGIRDTGGQASNRLVQWSYQAPVLENQKALLFATALPSCATDVSSQVSIVRSGFVLNRATRRYVQTITIKNTSSSAIQGPVSLVLDSLTKDATLYNQSGVTTCVTPLGSPHVSIEIGSNGSLGPGESAKVKLEFVNPSNKSIKYNARVFAGSQL